MGAVARFGVGLLHLIACGGGSSPSPAPVEGGQGGSADSPGALHATPSDASVCARVAPCCPYVLSQQATCELTVERGDEAQCELLGQIVGLDCSVTETVSTSDGWQAFSAQAPGFLGLTDMLSIPLGMFTTRDGSLLGWSGSSLYRSSDRGRLWADVASLADVRVVAQAEDGMLFALSEHGVATSTSDGQSWAAAVEGHPELAVDLALATDGRLFAIGTGGLAVSADRGQSWERMIQHAPAGKLWVDSVGAVRVIADGGLFFFDAARAMWVHQSLPLDTPPQPSIDSQTGEQTLITHRYRVGSVAALSDGTLLVGTAPPEYFRIAGGGILRSVDHGQTWDALGGIARTKQFFVQRDIVFAIGSEGIEDDDTPRLVVSLDRGETWLDRTPDAPGWVASRSLAVFGDGAIVLSPEYDYDDTSYRDYLLSPPLSWDGVPPVKPAALQPASCFDRALGAPELDVDCGGACEPCADWGFLRDDVGAIDWVSEAGAVFRRSAGTLQASVDQGALFHDLGPEVEIYFERDATLYGGRGAELVSSTDAGQTWQAIGPLPGEHSRYLGSVEDDALVADGNVVFAAPVASSTWQAIHTFDGPGVESLGQTATALFVQTSPGTTFQSTNGREWAALALPIEQPRLITEREGTLFLVGVGPGVHASTDQGGSWAVVAGTEELVPSSLGFNSVSTLLIGTDAAFYACSGGACRAKTAGICPSVLGLYQARADRWLAVFPDDRVLLASSCLSVPSTGW